MPQSLSNIILHIVFSTRNRTPFISKNVGTQLHAYLAAIARKNGGECYRVGGVADHVHLAVRLSRTMAPCKLVEDLKTASSKWLKKQDPEFHAFSWQRGYAAFSVNAGGIESLCRYIETQAEHHRKFHFQYEYRALLNENGIDFDERYMWD